ncbi:NB-ARC domain containing protein [Trema orientale]|uniref:NB-ARC domain containing protein n=1 Tax=Trema orientale TaxID=63057 RepID=A0A2P5FLL9_TREOI|nr:NB-ARC domain containing protein [Trema orientale]
MAEVFIATKLAEAVVSQVVQRISNLLHYEATSLSSVREEVESLRTELTRIKYFLKDADSKQEQDERVRNWVAEVRDVACEIEDAIETYIFKVHSTYIKAFHLRKLRSQINSIKDKIRSIRESRQTYQIEFSSISGEGSNSSLNKLRRSYPDDEDKDVISLKDTMMDLKAQLIKEEDRLCVVSIVGMGGLGKTTLAKKVYNDVDVKKLFDSQAWVFISQQYALREVLCEILMQIGFQSQLERKNLDAKKYTKELLEERKNRRENLKDLEERELLEWVKAELDDKRYLIVLDDIWSIDAWYGIKKAFPKGKMGSKVLFTTRKMEVAKSADPYGFSIEPPLLTLEESWELLQRKAFLREQVGENSCRPEYEKVGKELVEKCRCLPLAIVVLGGLLRTKNSLEAWEKVQKDVHSHLVNKIKSDEQYSVEDILHLSFQDLPYYLKPCFLYLGCFPEDSEIRKHKLIRLWIAEGFVQMSEEEEARGLLIEDVAEQYLEELINRCIVQVGLRDHTGKGVKTFRLHDLMRDFCMSKSKDEAFFKTIEHNDETINRKMAVSSSCHYSSTTNSRRIAVHDNDGHLERRSPQGIYAEDLIRYDGVLELTNIRDLGISGFLSDKEVSLVLNSLGSQLICLRSLQMNFREGEFPNLELNQEKLAILEKLPNLRILQLTYDWVYNGMMSTRGDGYKLVFSIGGFPKLEILTLAHLFAFEDWEVEEGAMRNLKRLDTQHIPKLKMIPDGLKYVTTLREFNISEMREEFGDRVRVNEDRVEGEDFYKVRHIPSISIK